MLSIHVCIFVVIYVLWRIVPSVAYSWQLNAAPVQCTDISITVTGMDGLPPYSVLVVPYGPPLFQNKIDVRGVIQKNFDGNSNSVNVSIKYPANTQFVAVVSDSGGFGSGGASVPTTVGESGDNSCINGSQTSWASHFWFFIGPLNQPTQVAQCNTTRIWWNRTADVEQPASFIGIIPGGLAFNISEGSGITNTSDEGIGFSWVPRIREGTQLFVVGGDRRGLGAGGSAQLTISPSDNSSCVTVGSPGIAPGAVAGAVESTRDMTAIIGGAVGGSIGFSALCAAALLLYIRHRRHRKYTRGNSIIFEPPDDAIQPSNPLPHYDVKPFTNQGIPINGFGYENTAVPMMRTNDRLSTGPDDAGPWSGSILPSSHRYIPAIIIQHTDNGPGGPPAENVPATINLPPTYDSLMQDASGTWREEQGTTS